MYYDKHFFDYIRALKHIDIKYVDAYQQVVTYNKTFDSLAKQTTQLYNRINTTKKQIKKHQSTLEAYLKLNKALAKDVKKAKHEAAKITQRIRIEKYGKPLLEYKEFNNLTFPQLAEIVGVPIHAIRHTVYTGEIFKYEIPIKKFVKTISE